MVLIDVSIQLVIAQLVPLLVFTVLWQVLLNSIIGKVDTAIAYLEGVLA
jgi:hypothetical protein